MREQSPRFLVLGRRPAFGLLRLIVLVLLPALAGAAWATDAGTIDRSGPLADSPKPIKVITLSHPVSVQTRSYPGYLKARFDAVLSFRVSGPLTELPALKGKMVDKDELLARLDPRDYQSALNSLNSDVAAAKERLLSLEQARPEDIASAEAAVAAAKATAENDRINMERDRNLYTQGVVPKSTLDQAEATANVSKSAFEQATQNLQKARLGARTEDIRAAQASLESLEAKRDSAKDALSDTELRAPFAGIVAERYVENHQVVAAQERVLALQDLNTFEVVINVPEQLLILNPRGSILERTEATARFDVIPDKLFPLVFKEYSTRVDIQAQTFAATFYLSPEATNYTFLPGMSVTVDVKHKQGDLKDQTSFVLPSQSVQPAGGGTHFVWRLAKTDRDGVYKTEKAAVTVGEFSHSGLLVTSGVKAGEKYAVTGAAFLREGALVQGLEWEGK